MSGLWDTPLHTYVKCGKKKSLELESGLCCFAYQCHKDTDIHFLRTHINWCKANYTVKQRFFSLSLCVCTYIYSPYQQFCSFALRSLGLLGCDTVLGVLKQCFSLNLKGHVAKEEYLEVYLVKVLATQHCTPQNYWIMVSYNFITWEGCGRKWPALVWRDWGKLQKLSIRLPISQPRFEPGTSWIHNRHATT